MTERVKKTTLACDNCRRRKRKCDGRTPTCTACEKNQVECGYTPTIDHRKPPPRNYVAALEARIAQLEQILKDAESSDTTSSQPDTSPTTPCSSPHIPQPSLIPSLTDPIDTTPDEFTLEMEGYTPLLSLAHEHKLLAQFWDWQRMHHPYVAPVPFLSSYAIHSELVHPDEPIPSHPPPPPAGFTSTALNVPRAAEVARTPDLREYISPLLLYSMFAIAALFHGDPDTGELFYEKAREMVVTEAANPRVATVQGVCLVITWEMGHARSAVAWSLVGVALSLCVRLGLNVDATPLLASGAMSRQMYETRNFVYWAAFNTERFTAMCMGMRPFTDRRTISTPKHSSPTAGILQSRKSTDHTPQLGECATWWGPSTLGMGDVLKQAAWDAIRDQIQMTEDLFDSVYATNAHTRTPQEILQLVTQNHLRIQKFIDNLPTWLRSTGAIRRKESGLVYIHLFIHLTSILTNRPFLSSHHAPSSITRQYKTLAYKIARASALQISSLIRHIPLSSPCVTIPYVVYSASTILLLAPEDPASMDGVRTGLACLDGMDESGYWVCSARDAARRVRALAERWGVGLESSRRVLGLIGGGVGSKVYGSVSPVTAGETEVSDSSRPSTATAHTPTGITEMGQVPIVAGNETVDGFAVPGYVDLLMGLDGTFVGTIDAAIDQALQLAQPHVDSLWTTQNQLPYKQMGLPGYDPLPLPQHPHHQHTYHPYKRRLAHVGYASSHADPQHDMHIPHSHWHTIIPSDPALFPPDASACADMGRCFSCTVEQEFDPAFVDRVGDPYGGVAVDWVGVGLGF